MRQIKVQIDKIVERILIFILGIMVINVLWQVFSRFFTMNPSSFTDELSRYLMVWLGILGASYVAGKKEHVAIDYFTKKLNKNNRIIIDCFVNFSIISFSLVVMLIGGGYLVYITIKLEQHSPSLKIPLGLVYSIMPICGILIIFYKLCQIKKY